MAGLIIHDSRFEKPGLFYPGRKPVGNVKIDASNPLSKGLVLCVVGDVDLVNNFPVGLNSSEIQRGDILHDNVSDSTALEVGVDSICPTEEISVAMGYKKTDATLRISNAFAIDDASLPTMVRANLPYSDGVAYFDFNLSGSDGTISKSGLTFGDDNWVLSSSVKNDLLYMVQNGLDVNGTFAAAKTRTRSATGGFLLGDGAAGIGDLAIYRYIYVYNRQLSMQETKQLNENPYRFLIPA